MHYHPETLLVLHKERQSRLEAEAARHTLMKTLPSRLKPVPVRLRPLPR